MSVVRELIARLGFQVDPKGFKQAEKAIDKVKRKAEEADRVDKKKALPKEAKQQDGGLKKLGQLAAAAGLTTMIEHVIELGSRAEETQNVLGAVFGKDGAADVTRWAEETSAAVGRSKYALAEMAGQLGAVAGPMLGNKDRAREMSEAFTKLAVDMGSFYNSSDEDALAALRSAMTGEVESIKRYGVVMNEATMQEYARTQGIKKKISAMTIAEKTELRYGFIMKTTADAQGDAARTGNGYANSIKNVKGMLTDFGTDMGRAVLPRIEQMLVAVRDGIRTFKEMTEGTYVLQAAMYTLSGVAALLAFDLLAPFIAPAIAIGVLVLAVDELYNLMTGGKTVIGQWLDSWKGEGTAQETVQGLRDAIEDMQNDLPDWIGMWDLLGGAIDDVGYALQRLMDKFVEVLTMPARVPRALMKSVDDSFSGLLEKVPGYSKQGASEKLLREQGPVDPRALATVGESQDPWDYEYSRARGQGVNAGASGGIRDEIAMRRRERENTIRGQVARRAELREQRRKQRVVDEQRNKEESVMSVDDTLDTDQGASVDPDVATADRDRRARYGRWRPREKAVAPPREDWTGGMSVDPRLFPEASISAPPAAAPVSSAAPPVVLNQTNHVTNNINGGNPNEMRRVFKQSMDASNRQLAASIPRPGGG